MKPAKDIDFKVIQLRIRYTVSRRGMTMGEISEHLGVDRRTYYYWFNAKTLRLNDLNRIASFLGVDICYLLGCKGALNDDF